MGLEGLEIHPNGRHVFVRLQIDYRTGSSIPPKSFDVFNAGGIRPDVNPGKDFCEVHLHSGNQS
jgi:hypothetical protein